MDKIIGNSIPRFDAVDKVTGKALYPGDIEMPGQVFMKILFSERVHAWVKKIDTSVAETMPGVLGIYTAKDVPVNEYGLGVKDQPVLCGPGSQKPYTDIVRCLADQVAIVVAETEEQAEQAKNQIHVIYEDIPPVFDLEKAMNPGSQLVHPERKDNIFCHNRIRKGDVEKAFQQCAVIVEDYYETPIQEHAYLQPEAGISYLDENNRITVLVAGQWIHEDQEQIAHALGMPLDKIRVIYPAIGGAFGGREDMSIQIVLALAVMKLNEIGIKRPVKIVWSRSESIRYHHKRHPFKIKAKWGANKDGLILAAKVEMIADGGAYVYTSPKVLGNATLVCTGTYNIPNVHVDSYAVYTNNGLTGAFRGFGGPQAAFQAEMQVNKLAEKLKMDPVEFRMRNLIEEGELLSVGSPLPKGISIQKVIEKCAVKAGWTHTKSGWQRPSRNQDDQKSLRKGLGFACSYKNVGFSFGYQENCWAEVEIRGEEEIKEVFLKHAGADVGQGAHSAFKQMTAEVLKVPVEIIHLIASDTASSKNSGSASASRMTFMAGNSIKQAATLAFDKWQKNERPAIAEYTYLAPKTTPFDPLDGHCDPNFAYGYVAEAIELVVDPSTGETTITNVICCDDVGQAINPIQVEGQIEGAIVQAFGYTFMENFIQKEGKILTSELSTYLIPTIMDIPHKVDSIIYEHADPIGPWGARGMGEMPFLPFAPAAIDAMHDATNIWFNDFPLTAEKVHTKLSART